MGDFSFASNDFVTRGHILVLEYFVFRHRTVLLLFFCGGDFFLTSAMSASVRYFVSVLGQCRQWMGICKIGKG